MSVLEHEGLRCAPYTTTYFDTKELLTYHDHLKGRRKRFKIRIRHYRDPSDGYLEIKLKKPRGQTLKVRWSYDVSRIGETLSSDEIILINQALSDSSYSELTDSFRQTLQSTFNRTTLFDISSRERITIDTQFIAALCGQNDELNSQLPFIDLGQHCAIIEIKSPTKIGNTHRVFTQLGIRESSISKYCTGLSALRPDLVNAPWREALRLLQGAGRQQHNSDSRNT